jgi:hypothetical protein
MKSWIVSGLGAALTAARLSSQCAETHKTAPGRGNRAPSPARKSRAGQSSTMSVGDPWVT